MPASVEELQKVPLFSAVPQRELKRLAPELNERRVAAGSSVVTQGEGGIAFFIIASGHVRVELAGRDRRLGPGDHFGELALLAGDERSATVTAEEDCLLYGLTAWHFKPFVESSPGVAWALLQTLARWLAEAERPGT